MSRITSVASSDPQNLNNIKAERGNSSGDVRQNFTFNLLYDVPLGEGHRFLSSGFGSKLCVGLEGLDAGNFAHRRRRYRLHRDEHLRERRFHQPAAGLRRWR